MDGKANLIENLLRTVALGDIGELDHDLQKYQEPVVLRRVAHRMKEAKF
jgi:hypothetical protein